MTDEELQAIRKRWEGAAKGPYKVDPDGDGVVIAAQNEKNQQWIQKDDEGFEDYEGKGEIIVTDSGYYPPHGADLEFFAHSWEDIRDLLAEVENLRANQLVGE